MKQENIFYIKDQEALAECVKELSGEILIGLDTETTGLVHEQHTKVSLIQLAVGVGDNLKSWVIDCFSKMDLRPIRDIIMNPNICKVIHNAEFDVAILLKCFGWPVRNTWCTLMAEKRTGVRKSLKLKDLAFEYFRLNLDKSHQMDDWSVRPLTNEQIIYAGLDPQIALKLYQEQSKSGLNGSYDKESTSFFLSRLKVENNSNSGEQTQEVRTEVESHKIKLDWDEEMSSLVDWFLTSKLPKKPFTLQSGHNIINPEKWYKVISTDIESGPKGPRAQSGTLKSDILAFKQVLETFNRSTED